MKIEKVIKISTETLAEEQFILNRFPEAYWVSGSGFGGQGKTTFYLEPKYEKEAAMSIREWEVRNSK